MEQTFFNYNLKSNYEIDNFFVGSSNLNSFNFLVKNNNLNNNIFLIGPEKSGKTHLATIWKKKFKAVSYNNNFEEIINNKRNILIDDVFKKINEEQIFHIINHCKSYDLKILLTSHIRINNFTIKIKDLYSRLKFFINIEIDLPDDELLINLMVKLFHDKQIIVKNPEIFNYIIKRVDRSYERVFILINKIDILLLKKNKQLTIPLIKELI